MIRAAIVLALSGLCALPGTAAQSQKPDPASPPSDGAQQSSTPQLKQRPAKPEPTEPYKDEDGLIHRPNPGESSSKSEPVDLTPPDGDDKAHPSSEEAVREAEDAAGLLEGDEIGGIQEFHPFDPHKAQKDIEVGDFYFKRENYRAALDRYEEALYYKNNDAIATYKLAVCQEKVGESDDARKSYQAYLKILPEGPSAEDARKALVRLGPPSDDDIKPKSESKQPDAKPNGISANSSSSPKPQ